MSKIKKYVKCKFQFAFLEGEIDIEETEDEVMIVNIDNMEKGKDGGKIVYFIMNEGIMFKRSKKEKNLFIPSKFISGVNNDKK